MSILRRHVRIFGAFSGLLVGSLPTLAYSDSQGEFSSIPKNYNISGAVEVYVTPRGQNSFTQHEFRRFLEANDLHLGRGGIPQWTYDATETFSLGSLPGNLKAHQKTLDRVRDLLVERFEFALKDPKFHAIIREIDYLSEGFDFALEVDPAATKIFSNGSNGIVVNVSLIMPDLRIWAQQVCGYDSNNPVFGTCQTRKDRFSNGFGIYHPWIRLADRRPIVVTVPVYLQIQPGGRLDMTAMKPQTNFAGLKFEAGQDPELLLPTLQFETGERTSTLKKQPLEAEFRKLEPRLVKLGVQKAQELAIELIPSLLDEHVFTELKKRFEQVVEISAPGTGSFYERDLQWSMRPSRIGYKNGFVSVSMDGRLDDPENIAPAPDTAQTSRRKAAILGVLPENKYDFALAVNLDTINRMIQLGYKRGNFKKISIGNDEKGQPRFAEVVGGPPVMSAGLNGHGRVHVVLRLDRDGSFSQALALKKKFRIELDVDFIVRWGQYHAYELLIDHIDLNTARILPADIKRLSGKVAEVMREELVRVNRDFQVGLNTNPTTLTDPIELPPELIGLVFHGIQGAIDPSGYLVFYMGLGEEKK